MKPEFMYDRQPTPIMSWQYMCCGYTVHVLYSGPSLSGHSQQRPPSLMWPHIVGTATMNAFTFPSYQRPLF